MKKIIEIIFSPTGELSIDAVGFKGADCEQATAYLEEALGVVARREKKPEYHQRHTNKHHQRIGT